MLAARSCIVQLLLTVLSYQGQYSIIGSRIVLRLPQAGHLGCGFLFMNGRISVPGFAEKRLPHLVQMNPTVLPGMGGKQLLVPFITHVYP